MENVKKSILAGLLISLGGIFNIMSGGGVLGAVLFSIGLISVISFQANLYTGKIGYISKSNWKQTLLCGVINLISAAVIGMCFNLVNPGYIVERLFSKSCIDTFFGACICGMCIYLAVEGYRRTTKLITIILPVVAFILSGADHCIANIFYFAAAGQLLSIKCLTAVAIAVVGNSVGALLLRWLTASKPEAPNYIVI